MVGLCVCVFACVLDHVVGGEGCVPSTFTLVL